MHVRCHNEEQKKAVFSKTKEKGLKSMKMGSKFLSFALIIIMLSSIMLPVYAEEELSVFEKADILNELSLLSGDGNGNYLLDKTLLRSEAATFITRLLGKSKYVEDNRDLLSITKYPDVPANQWYAPYVGYCSNVGIIAGNDQGMYEPSEEISEKAFLKLLIVALGYEYGKDFSWTTVFKVSYELGLVNDASYLTKTQDNLNYPRREVVNAMYNALTKTNKKTNITLLQNLVNENVITADQAKQVVGQPQGTPQDLLQQVIVSNGNCIIVYLNKNIKALKNENISIYESENVNNKLTVTNIVQQDKIVVIYTSNQGGYINYTLDINNVYEANGTLPSNINTTFVGHRDSQLQSDFFRISKIEQVSNNTVNVYFTHPINLNSEDASYYEILQGDNIIAQGRLKDITAKYSPSINNMVTVSLSGTSFVKDTQYTLRISGKLTSAYGVRLNDEAGDSIRFSAKSIETAVNPNVGSALSLAQISLPDYKTLQLEFSMELHPTRAQQIYSYYITDQYNNPVAINKAVLTGNGRIVQLAINGSFIANNKYKLTINEVNDVSRQYSIFEKEYSFVGNYSQRSILNIKSVTAIDKNCIEVSFDRQMDKTSAEMKDYYIINGVSDTGFAAVPIKAVLNSSDPSKVTLYFTAGKELSSGKTYKLTVVGAIKDSLGYVAGVNREATFYGSSATGAKPYISDAVIISKDTIKVNLSRDIAFSLDNLRTSNYYIKYVKDGLSVSKVPVFVNYFDGKTLILKFDELDFSQEYTIGFNSLTDYSEMYTRTITDGQNTTKVRMGK